MHHYNYNLYPAVCIMTINHCHKIINFSTFICIFQFLFVGEVLRWIMGYIFNELCVMGQWAKWVIG